MRTDVATTLILALAAAAWHVLAPRAAAQVAAEPRPVPSRRTALVIPFRIAAAANPQEQAVEVQLMVSSNRGLQWRHAGSARPEAGKIAFHAPGDGEYWFCVKTKDAAGRVRPEGPPAAELRVLVDTTRPQLRLNVWRGVDGDVTARWDATDANLSPQSFKIQYRRSGLGESWQPLPASPPSDARGSYADTVTWKSAEPVEVQAEIADLAGNVEVQTVETSSVPSAPLGNIGTGAEGAAPGEGAPPVGQTGGGQNGGMTNGRTTNTRMTNDAVRGPDTPSSARESVAPGPSSAPVDLPWQTQPAKPIAWPPENAAAPPIRPRSWEISAGGASSSAAAPTTPSPSAAPHDPFAAGKPSAPSAGEAASPWPSIEAGGSPFPARIGGTSPPAAAAQTPAARGSVTNPFAPAAAGASPSAPEVAQPASRTCLFNSRLLELTYDLGTVPPADVRSVELWGTSDGGQSWRKVAADDDGSSPVAVTIDADGVYGFRLLVHKQGGPLEFPPASGQPPELVVEIDQTPPNCHLTRVDQLAAARSSELVIGWEAGDRRLAERPVTLRWSHSPHGPWQTIAAGLENTGSYTWPMPDGLPEQVFLRLEARDAADNLGQFTADKPITPQRAGPAGRLRGVQPAEAGRVTDLRTDPRTYLFR